MFTMFGHSGSMTFPMTYDYDAEGYYSSRRSGWKNLSSLEKALTVSLTCVSVLAIALMIAVIVVGVKLNEDNYQPPITPTEPTKYPPWVTTISTTTTGPIQEVTTRERPTSQPPTPPSTYALETCVSTECFRAAGEIMMSMNPSVHPCDDFYKFSCGGWIKNNPIPESRTSVNQFDKMQDRLNLEIKNILETEQLDTDSEAIVIAKQFYETCLSQDGQEGDQDEIRKLIEEIMTDSETGKSRPLAVVLAKIRKELDGNYIFKLNIDTDLQDSYINAIYLDHLEFGLPPVYLEGNSTDHQHILSYKHMIMNFWITIFPTPLPITSEIAENIIKFERNLLEISSIRLQEDKAPEVKVFNTASYETTFGTLNIDVSEGETWKYFVDEVMKDIIDNCTEMECDSQKNPNVILTDVNFFDQIDLLINETENSIIGDYLKWRIILDYAADASENFRGLLSQYDQKIYNSKQITSRWENCMEKANYFFGSAISTVYMKEKINDLVSYKTKLNSMVETLKDAFFEILHQVPWITTETHDLIMERLDNLQIFAASPDSLENENATLLESDSVLNVTKLSSHFQNVLDLVKWRSDKELKTILLTSEETIYMRATEIQTTLGNVYSSLSNSIYFPMGILETPVYRDLENDTLALNYGSMGMLLGRMLIEAFEDTATSYSNETLIGMWDFDTLTGFENSTDCIKRQYSGYKVSELQNKISINGQNTVEMNTADLGGLKIAVRAYASQQKPFQEKILPGLTYTPDQLFYLSFAQTWCSAYTPERLFAEVVSGFEAPAPYRVRGVLENSEEFIKAWNCPLQEDKGLCSIW